ncbi:MAG: hypothetical protein J5I90_09535 [Caldilineales bacterium]|nr:hypothetical protein [Caldilineales bacterium]
MIRLSSLTTLWPTETGHSTRSSRTRPQQAFWAIMLIAGVALALCLYVQQASRATAVYYDRLGQEQLYARIERENSVKLVELAQAQSIEAMDAKALAMGYGPAKNTRFVAVQPIASQASNWGASVDSSDRVAANLSQTP